jgi:hypothetical protein
MKLAKTASKSKIILTFFLFICDVSLAQVDTQLVFYSKDSTSIEPKATTFNRNRIKKGIASHIRKLFSKPLNSEKMSPHGSTLLNASEKQVTSK